MVDGRLDRQIDKESGFYMKEKSHAVKEGM